MKSVMYVTYIVKFTHKKAKTLDILVEYLRGCLQRGPRSTRAY
jgi:hypothetical protein